MATAVNRLYRPIYGAAFRFIFPILDESADLVADVAGDTPDTEISKNEGNFADCTNELTEIETNSGMYYIDLTATEMTADSVALIAKCATAETKTTPMTLYPRRLPVLRSGTSQAGAAGTITLDAGASADDDFYNGLYVLTDDGDCRFISDYVGSTKVATIAPNWSNNPDGSSTFEILVPESAMVHGWGGAPVADVSTAGYPVVDVGKIENADPTDTIRDAVVDDATRIDASSVNAVEAKVDTIDGIVDDILVDVTGINGDAMRGTDSANTTVPDAAGTAATLHGTTDAAIAALNDPTAGAIADAVLDEASAAHVAAGSVGKLISEIGVGGGGAGDATLANQVLQLEDLEDIKGTGFGKDTDSLVNLSHTTTLSGAGADSVTITTTTTGGVPVADADVWITSDEAGTNVVAGTAQTDSTGAVTFMLDAGTTYWLWRQKDGVNFDTVPESFVAVAD